mgnify:CR=1 FL=1
MDLDFELAKQKGISSPYAVGFMPYTVKDGRITVDYAAASRQLAMDAAASTAPNIGAPAALYTYIDPRIVQVLFGVTNASKFFAPNNVESWEQEFATFEVEEIEGNVTAYNDYADGVTTDVNYNFPSRQIYRYQTTIKYGDLESDKASAAKIPLVSRKQFAAAEIIARAENKFQMYGVKGIQSYGMLNDPNLPSSISPISVNSKSTWADKVAANPSDAANIVFNDVMKLWGELTSNNGGNVDVNNRVILGVSNKVISYLTIPNTYGKTAKTLLTENFSSIEIVQAPELSTASGEMLYMVVPELFGEPTGECAFSERFRMGRLVAETSSFRQKASAATWGCVIRRPSLVATMLGV